MTTLLLNRTVASALLEARSMSKFSRGEARLLLESGCARNSKRVGVIHEESRQRLSVGIQPPPPEEALSRLRRDCAPEPPLQISHRLCHARLKNRASLLRDRQRFAPPPLEVDECPLLRARRVSQLEGPMTCKLLRTITFL